MEPVTLATRGYIGCSDLTTALASRGYICSTIVVDLPCRRVVTDITELFDTSLVELKLNTTDVEWLQEQTNILETVNASDIEEEINASNIQSVVIYGSTDLIELLNSTEVETPCGVIAESGTIPDFIPNGTFDTNISGWYAFGTGNSAQLQWNASGYLAVLGVGQSANSAQHPFKPYENMREDATYTLSFDVIYTNSACNVWVSSTYDYYAGGKYAILYGAGVGSHQLQFSGAGIDPNATLWIGVTIPQAVVVEIDNITLTGEYSSILIPSGCTNITEESNSSSIEEEEDATQINEVTNITLLKCKGD